MSNRDAMSLARRNSKADGVADLVERFGVRQTRDWLPDNVAIPLMDVEVYLDRMSNGARVRQRMVAERKQIATANIAAGDVPQPISVLLHVDVAVHVESSFVSVCDCHRESVEH